MFCQLLYCLFWFIIWFIDSPRVLRYIFLDEECLPCTNEWRIVPGCSTLSAAFVGKYSGRAETMDWNCQTFLSHVLFARSKRKQGSPASLLGCIRWWQEGITQGRKRCKSLGRGRPCTAWRCPLSPSQGGKQARLWGPMSFLPMYCSGALSSALSDGNCFNDFKTN